MQVSVNAMWSAAPEDNRVMRHGSCEYRPQQGVSQDSNDPVGLVHLVYLVCLVYLVYLIEPDEPDRPDRPDDQTNQSQAFSLNTFSLNAFASKASYELKM